MARDRQRAKQRKARREPTPPKRGDGDGIAPDARPLHRENVPGPVEHTGDVDQFEASLVAGAEGQEATDPDVSDPDVVDGPPAERGDEPVALGGGGSDDGDRGDDRPVDQADGDEPDDGRELALAATGRESGSAPAPARGATTPTENATGRGGGRFINFLRASWAELQRVQWPDRRQVGQATLVVLGFVLIAGAFLGFADFVANELVEFII